MAVPAQWREWNKVQGKLSWELREERPRSDLEERAVGCMLGVMIGDILGTPFEGYQRQNILKILQELDNGIHAGCFVPGSHMGLYHLPPRYGMYTDDTNSTLALADSLVACSGLRPHHVARNYGLFWRSKPQRGYPRTAEMVMKAVLEGRDPLQTGAMCFSEGSFANGGMMRISPVGLAFRNATPDELYEAVRMAIVSSHIHPEAIDAAFLQAYGVSFLLTQSPDSLSPSQYLARISALSRHPANQSKIAMVSQFFSSKSSNTLELSEEEVLDKLGSDFQIRSSEALACALWSFVTHWDDPEGCLIHAAESGGDTDTVCSIAAALCGALHGTSWIPLRWFNNCENGEKGRDYAIKIALQLVKLDLHKVDNESSITST
uniref:ADP-ribosylhydrolase ARH3 n=1 Tax=Arcella intermedia TaxID=1963864 RepID=A0A6B2L731_9EUKA